MGIFSAIKDKIFGKDEEEAGNKAARKSAAANAEQRGADYGRSAAGTVGGAGAGAGMSESAIEARLSSMQGADKLNWQSSIVDLMKLVDIDPSYENRKELATELGDRDYSGKAEENMALHKHLMKELAKSGGQAPANMRD